MTTWLKLITGLVHFIISSTLQFPKKRLVTTIYTAIIEHTLTKLTMHDKRNNTFQLQSTAYIIRPAANTRHSPTLTIAININFIQHVVTLSTPTVSKLILCKWRRLSSCEKHEMREPNAWQSTETTCVALQTWHVAIYIFPYNLVPTVAHLRTIVHVVVVETNQATTSAQLTPST